MSDDLREQWSALAHSATLHMLPTTALVASVQHLARELLVRDAALATLDQVRQLCDDADDDPEGGYLMTRTLRAALDGPGE